MNQQNFSRLACIVPVCNWHLDKPCFSKSFIKVLTTSYVCPGKPISNSDSPPSKPVSVSSVCTSKPISNRNTGPSETVSAVLKF